MVYFVNHSRFLSQDHAAHEGEAAPVSAFGRTQRRRRVGGLQLRCKPGFAGCRVLDCYLFVIGLLFLFTLTFDEAEYILNGVLMRHLCC